ncbi:hypothetical protein [Sphingomonas nostoxanthinifaciens]|nr:hypothetical protein [Sphingomonas nostoxanthinifaciens]UAK25513.1 hypothetical protein K8P63_04940 [Sphingomonas nostoxanthinifaciens]
MPAARAIEVSSSTGSLTFPAVVACVVARDSLSVRMHVRLPLPDAVPIV